MSVKPNSKLALIGINSDGTAKTLRGRVYLAIKAAPGLTRNELARYSHISINSLCGRVNELMKDGHIIELDSRPDRITGRMASPLEVKDNG